MAEYIEREAALSAQNKSMNLNEMRERLKRIPAADFRPVVLCRDCVHFSEVMYGGTQFEYGYCDRWADGAKMNPDDFCSRAEKREES